MQKQRSCDPVVYPVALPESFPISSFFYTQRFRSFQDRHRHACAELGLCLDGSGVFFIGEKAVPFRAGTISLIPPYQAHIAQSADVRPSRWWFCSFDAVTFGLDSVREGFVSTDAESGELVRLLMRELDDLAAGHDRQEDIALLLRYILRRLYRAQEERPLEGDGVPSILPAIQALTGEEDVTTEKLAELCHFSVSRFREVFRNAAGCTPMEYRTRVRLLRAADRLRETDDPVAVIAADVGFGSLSAFNRQFKAAFAVPPLVYRSEAAGNRTASAQS